MQCFPIRFRVDPKAATKAAQFHHVVVPGVTELKVESPGERTIQDLYSAMMADQARNQMIIT